MTLGVVGLNTLVCNSISLANPMVRIVDLADGQVVVILSVLAKDLAQQTQAGSFAEYRYRSG